MKLIRARHSGFCMGVRRAVNMVLEAVSLHKNVYTLGPLIHNPRVLERLKTQGVKILEESDLAQLRPGSTVIIRAHGVAPQIEKALFCMDAIVLDATCPHVKESQEKARYFAEKGYRIFLAGEENHAEIIGIRSYAEAAGSSSVVAANPIEAEDAAIKVFNIDNTAKTVLIGQTTISAEEYLAIGARIKNHFPNLEIVQSICKATTDRQEALRELCALVEAIIIAGSKESANTRRLLSLARELEMPSWLVEKPEDISPEIRAYEKVGLSAGASTPDDLLEEIEKSLI